MSRIRVIDTPETLIASVLARTGLADRDGSCGAEDHARDVGVQDATRKVVEALRVHPELVQQLLEVAPVVEAGAQSPGDALAKPRRWLLDLMPDRPLHPSQMSSRSRVISDIAREQRLRRRRRDRRV